MPLEKIAGELIPRLKQCKVVSATLTGGEPFSHPNIIEIVKLLRSASIEVGICTNATCITLNQMNELSRIDGIHFNVSLDGFSAESHGKFRGDRDSFFTTVETIRQLSNRGLIQGLLATPNKLADPKEYRELCQFAISVGAKYVLMNPLSSFGRGMKSKSYLSANQMTMAKIQELTSTFQSELDVVHIRFPNKSLPLGSCHAGNIIYIFTNGDLTVCPYLVFATEASSSRHKKEEFIVGNIFMDPLIHEALDSYKLSDIYTPGSNSTCKSCALNSSCGKGCPAAVIAAGNRLGDVDEEVCPVFANNQQTII